MGNTIANVLVGVATLGVRSPGDAYAEWTTAYHQLGNYSVALVKTGSGNPGSTHVQFNPTIVEVTFQDLLDDIGAGGNFSYYWRPSLATAANWAQFELRFEDPVSDAWFELTCVPHQGNIPAAGITFQQYVLVDGTLCAYGGQTPDDSSVWSWGGGLDTLSTVAALMVTDFDNAEAGSGAHTVNYILKRIRLELWEPTCARTCWIDTVVIDGTAYPIEIGSVTPGLSLSSPFADVGYTEDGVTIEYTADEADIDVEEETVPINRVITKETIAVTCNMAESSLANISNAMAGSVLSGSILTLGDGVNKTMNLKIAGINPAGFNREIFIPLATATGAVGMSYRKGEKTVVPVTFQALKGASPACTIVDNTA